MREITDKDKLVFGAFLNPQYPLGVRSIDGISKDTSLSHEEILETLERHEKCFFKGDGEHEGKYKINKLALLLLHPNFLAGMIGSVMGGEFSPPSGIAGIFGGGGTTTKEKEKDNGTGIPGDFIAPKKDSDPVMPKDYIPVSPKLRFDPDKWGPPQGKN